MTARIGGLSNFFGGTMKQFLMLATLAIGIPAFGQSKIVFTWTSGNVGSIALPACSSTVTTSCVTGYTLTMDSTTTVAGPSSIGPTLTTFTQTPLPAVGSHSYSLVMNGFDAVGNAIVSGAATTTVTV